MDQDLVSSDSPGWNRHAAQFERVVFFQRRDREQARRDPECFKSKSPESLPVDGPTQADPSADTVGIGASLAWPTAVGSNIGNERSQ